MKTVKIILLSVLCYAVSYIVGAAVGEYFGELIENVIVEDWYFITSFSSMGFVIKIENKPYTFLVRKNNYLYSRN